MLKAIKVQCTILLSFTLKTEQMEPLLGTMQSTVWAILNPQWQISSNAADHCHHGDGDGSVQVFPSLAECSPPFGTYCLRSGPRTAPRCSAGVCLLAEGIAFDTFICPIFPCLR